MNHSDQLAGISRAEILGSTTPSGAPRVDFSGEVLLTLDENHLDESGGVSGTSEGTRDIVTYYFPGGIVRPGPGSGPIDWNCISTDTETDVASHINSDGSLSSALRGFNDWGNLDFRLQCAPTFSDGPLPPASVSHDELDPETARRRNILFPILMARIDIRPNCSTNRIFLSSRSPVPVALFGSAGLDVAQIALSSLRFAGAQPAGTFQADIDWDRRLDLLAAFRRPPEYGPGFCGHPFCRRSLGAGAQEVNALPLNDDPSLPSHPARAGQPGPMRAGRDPKGGEHA